MIRRDQVSFISTDWPEYLIEVPLIYYDVEFRRFSPSFSLNTHTGKARERKETSF